MEYEHPVAACAVYGDETAAYNGDGGGYEDEE